MKTCIGFTTYAPSSNANKTNGVTIKKQNEIKQFGIMYNPSAKTTKNIWIEKPPKPLNKSNAKFKIIIIANKTPLNATEKTILYFKDSLILAKKDFVGLNLLEIIFLE